MHNLTTHDLALTRLMRMLRPHSFPLAIPLANSLAMCAHQFMLLYWPSLRPIFHNVSRLNLNWITTSLPWCLPFLDRTLVRCELCLSYPHMDLAMLYLFQMYGCMDFKLMMCLSMHWQRLLASQFILCNHA